MSNFLLSLVPVFTVNSGTNITIPCVTGGGGAWALWFAKFDWATKQWTNLKCIGGFDAGGDAGMQRMVMDPNGQMFYATGYIMTSYLTALGKNITSPYVDTYGYASISNYDYYDAFAIKMDNKLEYMYY